MRPHFLIVLVTAGCFLTQLVLGVAVAQEVGLDATTGDRPGAAATRTLGTAGDVLSLGLTGERRPLYKLQKSDVVEISFTFAPEFNQTVSVQPDGFISLRGAGTLFAAGQTLLELSDAIRQAYARTLHDTEVSVTLKDFEKPYFLAGGEVSRPGKYELRSDTTVAEAVAIAGGFNGQAKHSQVVLFRRLSNETVQARVLNLKQLLKTRRLDEDARLNSGDFIFVPQNRISKIRKYMPLANLSMYMNPAQF
jgi:polysaccharide biosynthesis/export protein